jgi:hypothetical protein
LGRGEEDRITSQKSLAQLTRDDIETLLARLWPTPPHEWVVAEAALIMTQFEATDVASPS